MLDQTNPSTGAKDRKLQKNRKSNKKWNKKILTYTSCG